MEKYEFDNSRRWQYDRANALLLRKMGPEFLGETRKGLFLDIPTFYCKGDKGLVVRFV